MDLTDKVVLVTGSSRGIGRATALALAEAGCHLVVNYFKSQEEAEEVVRQIQALGRKALAVRADVKEAEEVGRLVSIIEAELGPVDILVNNAGISPSYPLESISLEDWQRVLTANLTSAFLVSQAVLPQMRARKWGRLIMMSSVAAQTGGVIGPHYAASKAGMLGLVHSYAKLLAAEGITANAIAPAAIETDMIRGNPNFKPQLLPVDRFGVRGGSCPRCGHAGQKRLYHRANHQCQRRLVHELSDAGAPPAWGNMPEPPGMVYKGVKHETKNSRFRKDVMMSENPGTDFREKFPNLPERIAGLGKLAYNLWWSWHPNAWKLFQRLDRLVWTETDHNPVKLLKVLPPGTLENGGRRPGLSAPL